MLFCIWVVTATSYFGDCYYELLLKRTSLYSTGSVLGAILRLVSFPDCAEYHVCSFTACKN